MKTHGLVWLGCAAASSFRELSVNATHIQQIGQEGIINDIQYWTSDSKDATFAYELHSSVTREEYSETSHKIYRYLADEYQVRSLWHYYLGHSDDESQLSKLSVRVFPDTDGMVTLNFTIRDGMNSAKTNDYSGSANWLPEGWVNTLVGAWETVKGAMFRRSGPRPA